MGGNALKEFNTTRLPRRKAIYYGHECVDVLRRRFSENFEVGMVRSYFDKPDFGDIDIVVGNHFFRCYDTKYIVKVFEEYFGEAIPYVKNGPVLSLAIPLVDGWRFQVDIIGVPDDRFEFALNYFSWNDLGNLIGRVAHKLGLKFAHEGLMMVIRDGNHVIKEICLSKDFSRVLKFLGYDSERFAQGFKTLEDIFEFTASSDLFHPDIYKLENRNHTARVRDKKRPVYTAFLAWLHENDDRLTKYEFNEDKDWYLDMNLMYFYAERTYKEIMEEYALDKQYKAKFNGNLVSRVTGYSGKELGIVMKCLKDEYPFNDKSAVLELSDESLAKRIEFFLKK